VRNNKPTREQIEAAVESFGALLYFPADAGARLVIMRLLAAICGHVEGLQWLVATMLNRVGEWKGPAQLRALYATRYKPLDGIEGEACQLAGFTPADSEAAYLAGVQDVPPQLAERRLRELTDGKENRK